MGGSLSGILDPGGNFFGDNSTYNQITDPLDLFGHRAAATSGEISNIAQQSAADAITAQEEMRRIIGELMMPYQQRGSDALGDFTAMATSGEANVPMSPEYEWQRQEGLQNINRGMGSRGRRLSTARDKQAGGFLNDLGQEEANRIFGMNLDAIKAGQGAVNTLGGAASTAGGNVGSIYSNMGNAMNMAAQNYGQNRQQSLQGAGNAFQGLGNYLAYT